jgi:ATP-dependent Clp protease ATP-binding subunit ClpC
MGKIGMKLTPRALKACQLAEAERRALGHPCVGSQHLLFGLFLLGSGVPFSILQKLAFTEESLRHSIVALGSVSEETRSLNGFVFGNSAAEAIERAAQETSTMSFTYTGTEHMLLGLLSEGAGGAASVFAMHKAETAKARKWILDEYAEV